MYPRSVTMHPYIHAPHTYTHSHTHTCACPKNTFSKHVGEMIKTGRTSLTSVCLFCHRANEHLGFIPLLFVYSRLLS